MKKLWMISTMLAVVFATAASAQTKTGDAENGKRLFQKDGCYQCHGWMGQGGLNGVRLAQTKLPQVAFMAYVRNPAPGGMPPFRQKVITDQELTDIYTYIKTFPEPKSPKDIPLLNQK